MKISAIITTYNGKHLRQSVQSILKQTQLPYEILIVDNGTFDEASLVQINEVSTLPLVRILRLDPNMGPAVARNTGWDNAKGDLVAFLDSGDMWKPEKLQIQSEFMQANPQYLLTGHWYDYQPWRVSGVVRRRRLLLTNVLSVCCILARRDFPLCAKSRAVSGLHSANRATDCQSATAPARIRRVPVRPTFRR